LVKNTPAPDDSKKLSSALSEAQSIIEAAEQRAEKLQQQATAAYDQAKSDGYDEGFKLGQEEAAKTAVRLISETTALSEALSREAAKLAVAICEQVIGEHMKVEPETVKRLAVRGLQEAIIGDSVTLVVHSEDEHTLKSSLKELRRIAGGGSIAIETDPGMTRGGCVVRTEFGEVDVSIDNLISSVSAHLGLALKGK